MKQPSKKNGFKIEVPLDASGIEGFKPEQKVKVIAVDSDGKIYADTSELNDKGSGKAVLKLPAAPSRGLRIVVGPENASDEELLGMQTLSMNLTSRQLAELQNLKIEPIKIHAYYWFWWLRWCRTYTIRGRLTCPDGSPVPGAKVCAFDVDAWWWWMSKEQVGCATTDATGAFEIKFRWCCGWLPWWWWAKRVWQLEPYLVERIQPEILKYIKLANPPIPGPKPDLRIFEELLADEDGVVNPLVQKASINSEAKSMLSTRNDLTIESLTTFDSKTIEEIGQKLKDRIKVSPAVEKLQVWPWRPWHPWWDCNPDIIFQVTQNCNNQQVVIVDEGYSDTRWGIPTDINVTLVASGSACCVDTTPQPEGNCVNLTHLCNDPVASIGGNLGAIATPQGFKNPGLVHWAGDRPYAGNIPIRGDFGTLAGADYYEFEWYNTSTSTWDAMPVGAIAGFNRTFYGPQLPAGPLDTWPVSFPVQPIDGRNVIESRQHFEANNGGAANWDSLAPGSRWWMQNKTLLGIWKTDGIFDDGTYQLRVKAWTRVGNNLTNSQILDQCGAPKGQANNLIVTLDNHVVGSGSGHPTAPDHPCGSGTVHTCTTEPDTDIIDVQILHSDGSLPTKVNACGNVPINNTDILQVDFMAHDTDGHLAFYTLITTWGENGAKNLLTLGGLLTSSPAAAPVPAAAQIGPYYGHGNPAISALDQGAISPIWHGGALRLQVPAHLAFKETCCYQLELRAYKRTIVNCSEAFSVGHRNKSEYSFMIVV